MSKRIYQIDGSRFSTLEEFAEHFSAVVLKDYAWRGNLDAFNDILRGGFGTPAEGFVIQWENSALSQERLGYTETIKWLEERIKHCHTSHVPYFQQRLEAAKKGQGPTLFDMLIEIISAHCSGGEEQEDGVELQLL